jgi:hypothetical protein
MRPEKLIALGLVAAFTLILGLQFTAVGEDKPDPKEAVRATLTKVQVATTKKDGSAWDVNDGKPDLVITFTNTSDSGVKPIATDEKQDVYEATYAAGMVLIKAGQKLRIDVEDKDVAQNDQIGSTEFVLTEDMVAKGSHSISFGQVKALTMTFARPKP